MILAGCANKLDIPKFMIKKKKEFRKAYFQRFLFLEGNQKKNEREQNSRPQHFVGSKEMKNEQTVKKNNSYLPVVVFFNELFELLLFIGCFSPNPRKKANISISSCAAYDFKMMKI